jgi:hypothetical protein
MPATAVATAMAAMVEPCMIRFRIGSPFEVVTRLSHRRLNRL